MLLNLCLTIIIVMEIKAQNKEADVKQEIAMNLLTGKLSLQERARLVPYLNLEKLSNKSFTVISEEGVPTSVVCIDKLAYTQDLVFN